MCQKFRCLGISLPIQNCVHGETKIGINSRNVFYHSVLKLSSSRMLHKNIRIKIYRTKILPVVLCGCETWSLLLRDEQRLRVFENRVLRKTFGPKREGEWRILHNEVIFYSLPDFIGR